MADFPANLRCSSLAVLAGGFEGATHSSIAGNVVTVQATNRSTNARLRVGFRGISAAEVATIRSHYDGEGTTRSWLLSAVLLDGAEFDDDLTTIRWRYAAPPAVKDINADLHDVDFELEQVPASFWVERYTLSARPATMVVGEATRLIGPDQPPALWVSRLTTTAEPLTVNGAGPWGSTEFGANDDSFQAFWFNVVGESSAPRVVVVKRSANGSITWQRWTAAALLPGDSGFSGTLSFTLTDMPAPQVLPMADGGCVVMASEVSSVNPSTINICAWRLDSSGTQLWRNKYIGTSANLWLGAAKLAHSNGVIYAFAAARNVTIGPALLRIDATNGDLLSARVYRIDGSNSSTTYPSKSNVIVLPSGRIVMKAYRDNPFSASGRPDAFILELSADGATIHSSIGFDAPDGGTIETRMNEPMARLADGSFVLINQTGFLRLDSNYNITSQGGFNILGGNNTNAGASLALKFDADGNGYSLNNNSVQIGFAKAGLSMSRLTNGANNVTAYSEVVLGLTGNIGGAGSSSVPGPAFDLNPVTGRGIVQASNNTSTCHVSAVGFALDQPRGSGSGPAATLDTGTCSNTMGVRGWDVTPTNIPISAPYTRSTVETTSATFSPTTSTPPNMVDASSSLTWVKTALLA